MATRRDLSPCPLPFREGKPLQAYRALITACSPDARFLWLPLAPWERGLGVRFRLQRPPKSATSATASSITATIAAASPPKR